MKVLWITNNIMPYPASKLGLNASCFGGWLLSLMDEISNCKDIELAIATVYDCDDLIEFNDGKIKYFLIPGKLDYKYYNKTEEYFKKLDKVFNADIVHLQGSEFYHGLAYLNALPNKKSILSVQGLVSICGREFLGGMTEQEINTNITFRDIIKRDNLKQMQKKYLIRGKYEKNIIEKVNYVLGRTNWDYNNVLAINPNIKYFKNNESLRSLFYNHKWNINKIEEHSIFVSQASQPLKGIHMLLKAIPIIKEKYNDVKVYVGGPNIIKTESLVDKLKLSGYGKYLKSLINENEIQNNVIFLGILNENEMINRLLKSNVFVLPSKIENSSNSLCEAMLLGLPCIASYVGGNPDMMLHDKEGYLYPFDDYQILAQQVIKLFEDKDLCLEFSKNARERSLQRNDLKTNVNTLYEIYKQIMKEK